VSKKTPVVGATTILLPKRYSFFSKKEGNPALPVHVSCLYDAGRRGDLALVQVLVEEGVPVDIIDSEGSTPLKIANAIKTFNFFTYLDFICTIVHE
jgi:hypothetical protein